MSNSTVKESIIRTMGEDFYQLFLTPNLIEIMLNPDEKVFYEVAGEPMKYWGKYSASRSTLLINYVASYHKKMVGNDGTGKEKILDPYIECEFPVDGSRFTATMPPITQNPSFTIRKKAEKIYTLSDYVQSNIMTEAQKNTLVQAVKEHLNILIIGGTGSGKTTLVNAVIEEISVQFPDERLVIIEDTGEIQCSSQNKVQFHTTVHVDMTQLLKLSLRYYPKRILVGEVRDGTALDLLDAWNTGHEGGVATLHADNAMMALSRLYGLIARNASAPTGDQAFIAIGEAVDIVVSIGKCDKGPDKGKRKVQEILKVRSYDVGKKQYIIEEV